MRLYKHLTSVAPKEPEEDREKDSKETNVQNVSLPKSLPRQLRLQADKNLSPGVMTRVASSDVTAAIAEWVLVPVL